MVFFIEGMTDGDRVTSTDHPGRHRRAVFDASVTEGTTQAAGPATQEATSSTKSVTPMTPVTQRTPEYDATTEAYIGPEPIYHLTYQVCCIYQ